jgi:hypothetical protein
MQEDDGMFTRETILNTLANEREKLVARYRAFTVQELEQVCTKSEAPGGVPWRVKDHLAHLASIERAFQSMIKRTIAGKEDPIGLGHLGSFKDAANREQILAYVHRLNQANVDAHYNDDFETLLADLTAARADTLELLGSLTDEQLALLVPGAPWADGSIGGVLITNAHHEMLHTKWVEDGLQASTVS